MAKHEERADILFPILNQGPTGLARLAADATHTADGHLIEFKALAARSILNKSISKRRLSLEYSINPYRGCEFACRYCYARYTHQFLEPDLTPNPDPEAPQPWATAFERRIYLKQNAAWLLEQELRKIDPAQEICIGTATDPYQPIERTARINRSLLEVFARRAGHRISMITKSTLIARDTDLLTRIAERNTLVLHLTITTPDTGLARILEPRAPRPDLRLNTVRQLSEAGLTIGILCSPLLPRITDSPEAINRMADCAAEAKASFFAAEPLFLKGCSRLTFLSFIREHFPALLVEYEARFAEDAFAAPAYRNEIAAIVRRACERHRFQPRSTYALLSRNLELAKKPAVTADAPVQACLFA